jgi:hypothetical protein
MAQSKGVLGTALVLTPGAERATPRLTLTVQQSRGDVSAAQSPAAALVAENALAPCLPLLEALAGIGSSTVTLGLSHSSALHVAVENLPSFELLA